MNKVGIMIPVRKRAKSNGVVRIEVMADSMRVGKTTAVKVLAEGLRKLGHTVSESYEDWQHNPYLKDSYADPQANFLESQKWFVRRKWEQIRDGGKGIFIQDVPPEMDYCYAETNRRLGRMSEENFDKYDKYYRSLDWSIAQAPDLLVYLQASDEVLLQRALDSKREFETVEPEYFLMMKKVNREWVEGITNPKFSPNPSVMRVQANSQIMNVLKIDTDTLDFAHEEAAKMELVNIVKNSFV